MVTEIKKNEMHCVNYHKFSIFTDIFTEDVNFL